MNFVKRTRSFHGPDCDTDHALVVSTLRIKPRSNYRSKVKPLPKINVRGTRNPSNRETFASEMKASLNKAEDVSVLTPDESWGRLKDTIHTCAVKAFGLRPSYRHDWVEENADTLIPLLEKKRAARIDHSREQTQSSRDRLKATKAEVQRIARKCANDYWTKLCHEIQTAADKGDAQTMYEKIKTAIGPTTSKCAPIKSASGEDLTDPKQQLDRWVEHYTGLYGADKPANPHLEEALERLPTMAELDEIPSIEELAEAILDLKDGKACGEDSIPAEVLKQCREVLLPELYKLLTLSWETGEFPHEMRNAKIVTLYKNKGDKGDCNNYRGISLLSITGKAFARIILKRLHKLAERVLPESQCGFRAGRSTMDMIFTLRQLQEKCREQNQPLYTAFIDLTKAFDTVSRSALYKVLDHVGCPPTLLSLIASFHNDMQAKIQFEGNLSESFPVNTGVKQGCVLAPTLFGIYLAALLHHAFKSSAEGVYVRTRTDGSLFNLARLKARTLCTEVLVRELLFADDAAIVARTNQELQNLLNSLSQACDLFGLQISLKKRR